MKRSKRDGRGNKTAGRGGKGQTARTGGGTRLGFEGGQTEVYKRFPKRGGRIKTGRTRKISYQIFNLAELEKDPKIVSGQTVDFIQKKSPVKVLGVGELTKVLTIKATVFSQSAQEKITKIGGKFKTLTSIYLDKIMNIMRSAEFSRQKKKDDTGERKIMMEGQEFGVDSFRDYVKHLINSKNLRESLLPEGQKKADLLRKLEAFIKAETTPNTNAKDKPQKSPHGN